MKKLLTTIAIIGLAFLVEAAETNTTFLKVLFPNTPTNVATCKVYYGSVAGQLTNTVTATNQPIYGSILAFGDCDTRVLTQPQWTAVRIDGLLVGSPFFFGCTVIDTNGVECPMYGITTCAFTVPTRPKAPIKMGAQ